MGFRVCTRKLTDGQSLVISASMNVLAVSFQMSSADGDGGTYNGDYTAIDSNGNELPSQELSLGTGEGQNIGTYDPRKPIDGVTLACVQGTMNITMYF